MYNDRQQVKTAYKLIELFLQGEHLFRTAITFKKTVFD